MSKELTPLEALKEVKKYYPFKANEIEYLNIEIIEKALKDYEKQDNTISIIKETIEFNIKEPKIEVKENGEISVLSRIGMSLRKQLNEKERELFREWVLKECFPKELKALEIIKKKFVDFEDLNDAIGEDTYHEDNEHNAIDIYNQNRFEYKQLTQEEFDLLKEVLL